jgi:HEAT repeat protein
MKREAAKALAQIGPDARDAAGALKSAAEDGDAMVAEEAVRALVKIDKDALPAIRAVLAGDKRQRAVADLQKIGAPALPFLLDALKATNKVEVRRQSAQAIAAINVKEEIMIVPLTRSLLDPDKDVRRASLQALRGVAIAAKGAIPNLLANLKDKDAEIRLFALVVLREIPVESDAIVKGVTPLLQDADEKVRDLAKEVLAFQGK